MTKSKSNTTTIRDVARLAGVSVATISRFINHTAPVSEEVAARVEAAMTELRFVPSAAARRLATLKTNTVGIMLTNIRGDFFAPMLAGVESVTSVAGLDLLISSSGQPGPRVSYPLGPHNTDGLLVFADSVNAETLATMYQNGFPVILIHQSAPDGLPIPCVTVENRAATRKLVEHLITAHGRRRIVFLRGPQEQEDTQWREQGYRQALAACGLTVDPALIGTGEFERAVAEATIVRMLSEGLDFDAVFCGDDEAAVGVLSALQKAGKRVPEEISVAGFDDQRLSSFLNPPLTTVRAPTEQVGIESARQLLRLMHGESVEPIILLGTEIVYRRSCGCSNPSA